MSDSKGIDYSKWDHFGDSSDDEEEQQPFPRVTRLDTPSRISTTTDGTIHVTKSNTSDASTEMNHNNKSKTFSQEWTCKGGKLKTHNNGATLYWSQDGETVILRLTVPTDTRSSDVTVVLEGAVSHQDCHCATLTEKRPTLTVTINTVVVLEGELPYPVFMEEDILDWTLETCDEKNKHLVISLNKAMPMPGMTLWWTRPMIQFEEIQLLETGNTSFQQAWDEAHAQFQQNIQQKKKMNDEG